MANIEPVGKRWRVCDKDGFYLLNRSGNIRYFNDEKRAQIAANAITQQETASPFPANFQEDEEDE